MSFSKFLRLLSVLFRRYTRVCRRLNVADYLEKLWSLILTVMRRLFRLHSASSHEPGPLPAFKSSAPVVDANSNATATSREGRKTTDAPVASGKIEFPLPHDLSRLEEGQQDHREITSPHNAHPSDEEFPRSTYDTPEEQPWLRSRPELLRPMLPWNVKPYQPRCKRCL